MKSATFSIIAFDPATGDLGVGVESHAFTAGAAVPYAIAGVGAVATQAAANRLYGPKAIELLKQGLSPAEVVKRLTDDDAGRDTRQLAIIDAKGRSAVYTGRHVIDRNSDVNDLVHLGGYAGQAGRPLQALMPLREAIRLHPNLARQAAADPLFANLRELAEFKRLVRLGTSGSD